MELKIGHYYRICGDGDVWVKLLEVKGSSGYFENTGWKSLKQAAKIPDFEILSKIQHIDELRDSLRQTVDFENVPHFSSLISLVGLDFSMFVGAKVEIYIFRNLEEKGLFVYKASCKATVRGYTLDTLIIKTENDEYIYSLPTQNFSETIGVSPYQSLWFFFLENVETDFDFITDIQQLVEVRDLTELDEEYKLFNIIKKQ